MGTRTEQENEPVRAHARGPFDDDIGLSRVDILNETGSAYKLRDYNGALQTRKLLILTDVTVVDWTSVTVE